MFYQPKHFQPEELISKALYDHLDQQGKLYLVPYFFDPRILETFDLLRDEFGPITINNWHNGGNLNQCGFRWKDSDVGAEYSQHRYGRAGDVHASNHPAEEIRQDLFKNPKKECYKHITCIELGVSWFHCDVRNYDKINGVLQVTP